MIRRKKRRTSSFGESSSSSILLIHSSYTTLVGVYLDQMDSSSRGKGAERNAANAQNNSISSDDCSSIRSEKRGCGKEREREENRIGSTPPPPLLGAETPICLSPHTRVIKKGSQQLANEKFVLPSLVQQQVSFWIITLLAELVKCTRPTMHGSQS